MTWLLELQDLDLFMTQPHPTEGYKITCRARGRDLGNPQAVIRAIQSQLMDGSLSAIDGFDNRPVVLRVKVEAPGAVPDPGAVLARGELAIMQALRWKGYGQLRMRPDQVGAETAVVEVVTGYADLEADEYADDSPAPYRVYQLTLNARPFVRPTTKIKIAAPPSLPATPNDSTVDAGTSQTGWSLLSTAPAPWRNSIPNPGFQLNTANWSEGTGTVGIVRQTVSGNYYALVESADNATRAYLNSALMPASPQVAYTFGATMDAYGEGPQGGLTVRFYNAVGTPIGADRNLPRTFPTTGWVDWVAGTITSPPGTASMRVFPWMNGTPLSISNPSFNWRLDRVWVGSGGATAYFDGSFTDTAARNYGWVAAAHASASTMTWTAPTFGVVSGALQATVWGRKDVTLRRTSAVNMDGQPYLRVRGQAYWDVNGAHKSTGLTLTFTVDGAKVNPDGFTLSASGDWEAILNLPDGINSTLEIRAAGTDGAIPDKGLRLRLASPALVRTDRPIAGTGRVQVRQVPILGAMRTELSILVEGRTAAGAPAPLGAQTLIASASSGEDAGLKFLSLYPYGPTGTSDPAGIAGAFTTLGSAAAPSADRFAFEFPAGLVTPGNYRIYLEVKPTITGAFTIFHRATVIPAAAPGLAASDPTAGWKTVPLNIGATWPAVPLNTPRLIPLQVLAFPPGDVEGDATIRVELAANGASTGVQVGEAIACNVTDGQVTLLDTSGGVSEVRLDAPTIDNPEPTIWIGTGGAMVQAPMTRIQAFGIHQAKPSFVSIGSVTPTSGGSLLSASYFDRYHSYVAPRNSDVTTIDPDSGDSQ